MGNDLLSKIENRKEVLSKQTSPAALIKQEVQKRLPEIRAALPSHVDAMRFERVILSTIRENPNLLKCEVASLVGCGLLAAQYGLEPGPLGQCYFIPYGAKAQFQLGYKGMIELARRSGKVTNIYAQPVYANDEFLYEFGDKPSIKHKPKFTDRGELVAFYAVGFLTEGAPQFDVMSKQEVDAIRTRSKAANSGPWVSDYNAMGCKTVIKKLCKLLPISIEAAEALQKDSEREFEEREPLQIQLDEEPVNTNSNSFSYDESQNPFQGE